MGPPFGESTPTTLGKPSYLASSVRTYTGVVVALASWLASKAVATGKRGKSLVQYSSTVLLVTPECCRVSEPLL